MSKITDKQTKQTKQIIPTDIFNLYSYTATQVMDILKRYQIHANSYPVLQDYNQSNKKLIRDNLLNGQDRAYCELKIDKDTYCNIYPATYQFLYRLTEHIRNTDKLQFKNYSLVNNYIIDEKKNKHKLSRIASKYITKILSPYCEDGKIISYKFESNAADYLSGLYCQAYKELKCKNDAHFLTSLFAPKKGYLILSTKLEDYLTINYKAGYSSCYDITGCHYTATTAYGTDNQTFILIMINDKGKKVGRCWGYFDKFKGITFTRGYGQVDQHVQKIACKYIVNGKLGNLTDYTESDITTEAYVSSHTDYEDTPIYWDNHYFTCIGENREIYLSEGVCLHCGNDTINTNYGLCESCRELMKYCSHCDKIIWTGSGSDVKYTKQNGRYYHVTCWDKHSYTCQDCGVKNINNGSEYSIAGYCADCYNRRYKKCYITSKWFDTTTTPLYSYVKLSHYDLHINFGANKRALDRLIGYIIQADFANKLVFYGKGKNLNYHVTVDRQHACIDANLLSNLQKYIAWFDSDDYDFNQVGICLPAGLAVDILII